MGNAKSGNVLKGYDSTQQALNPPPTPRTMSHGPEAQLGHASVPKNSSYPIPSSTGISSSHSSSASPNANTNTTSKPFFRFLDLPSELRLYFYDHLYQPSATSPARYLYHPDHEPSRANDFLDDGTVVTFDTHKSDTKLLHLIALLGTSKQIRQEALPFFRRGMWVNAGVWKDAWVAQSASGVALGTQGSSVMSGPWDFAKLEKVCLVLSGGPRLADFVEVFKGCKVVELRYEMWEMEIDLRGRQGVDLSRDVWSLANGGMESDNRNETDEGQSADIYPLGFRETVKLRHLLQSKVLQKAIWDVLSADISGVGGEAADYARELQLLRTADSALALQVLVSTRAKIIWLDATQDLYIIAGQPVKVRATPEAEKFDITINVGAKTVKIERGGMAVDVSFAKLVAAHGGSAPGKS